MPFTSYQTADAEAVIQLFQAVFSQSEGEAEGQSLAQLVRELIETDPQDLFGFVCRTEEEISGSIFFSRLTLPSQTSAFILSPVAIATRHQGKGLGQRLIHFGIQHLQSQGVELLLTYGDPNFYAKVGFESVSEKTIKAPFELTYPHGWLAQPLNGHQIESEAGPAQCVAALSHAKYW